MTDRETYLARAAEAHEAAAEATLDNVRDRCLRSEQAWMIMAQRAERTETMRATLLAAKAAAETPATANTNKKNQNESQEISSDAPHSRA